MPQLFKLELPRIIPPLDTDFRPAALANRAFRRDAIGNGVAHEFLDGDPYVRFRHEIFEFGHLSGIGSLLKRDQKKELGLSIKGVKKVHGQGERVIPEDPEHSRFLKKDISLQAVGHLLIFCQRVNSDRCFRLKCLRRRESLHECGKGILSRGDLGRRDPNDFLGTSDQRKYKKQSKDGKHEPTEHLNSFFMVGWMEFFSQRPASSSFKYSTFLSPPSG